MAFDLKDFIRKLNPDLFSEYCSYNQISFKFIKKETLSNYLDRFIAFVNSLDLEKQRSFESELRSIEEMFPETGFQSLLAEAKYHEVNTEELIEMTKIISSIKKIFIRIFLKFTLSINWTQVF